MGLREQQREAQRQRIAEAAFALFEERGYEGATVEAIAAAAGVSVPTLFRYFPEKADLVVGEDGSFVERFEAIVREAPRGQPLREVLVRAISDNVGRVGDRRGRLRSRLTTGSDELRRRQLDIDDRAIRRIAAAIAERLSLSPADPRPRAVAAATHGALRATMEAWRDDPGRTSLAGIPSAAIEAVADAGALLERAFPTDPR